MEEYIDFVTAVMLTALAIGIIGLIVAGGYMIYKFIKDEY
jgi:preprotein translocase subunit Sss1